MARSSLPTRGDLAVDHKLDSRPTGSTPAASPPVRGADVELRAAIRARHMVRAFTDRPVAPALVDELIDLARRAPSAGNTQPWHFVVLEGADTARLWDVTLPCPNAGRASAGRRCSSAPARRRAGDRPRRLRAALRRGRQGGHGPRRGRRCLVRALLVGRRGHGGARPVAGRGGCRPRGPLLRAVRPRGARCSRRSAFRPGTGPWARWRWGGRPTTTNPGGRRGAGVRLWTRWSTGARGDRRPTVLSDLSRRIAGEV